MSGFVYRWTNLINNKKYVGSHHGNENDGYTGSGKLFLFAVKKYGIDNFKREILEYVETGDLRQREQFYLDKFNVASDPGYYNLMATAGSGWDYVNNGPKAAEFRKKSRLGLQNWLSTHEHPRGMLGKKHTTDTKEHLSSVSKKWADENKSIPVYQFTFGGKLLKKHDSISSASMSVGGNTSNIKYTCDGKFTNAYGYLWGYHPKIELVDISRVKGKKLIRTPDGLFHSIVETMRHYKYSYSSTIIARCISKNKKWAGWSYEFRKN